MLVYCLLPRVIFTIRNMDCFHKYNFFLYFKLNLIFDTTTSRYDKFPNWFVIFLYHTNEFAKFFRMKTACKQYAIVQGQLKWWTPWRMTLSCKVCMYVLYDVDKFHQGGIRKIFITLSLLLWHTSPFKYFVHKQEYFSISLF